MPSSSSESTRARRALIEEIKEDKRSWLRHGVAALAVSVLGLGVAGSMALTGAAQHTTWTATVATNELPKETSRGAERSRLDSARVKSLADQRAEELSKIDSEVSEASMDKSAKARDKALEAVSDATRRQAILIKRGQANRRTRVTPTRRQRRLRWQGLLARHQRLQHCCSLRPGRSVVALSHRLGLLLSRRHPIARSGGWGRHERRESDLPAVGPATMSLSSTRMAPTH